MTQPRLLGNRYELTDTLGFGGMAEVHRGRDVRLGREIAIKVLRADLARDPAFQTRFRREAQAAASLNHPAIVAVYDTGEDTPANGQTAATPYIVMEYVEGRTLRDILKTEGPLHPQRAMEVTADICAALEFSHRNGIVHRDVKPANVMITSNGAVKVMDFGIARAMTDNVATVTQTAAVIGTAQYLSPEQAKGESVDARSDVYSTGCLLYELVSGRPPFTGDSPVAVAYQHVREDAAPPSSINPDVPGVLDSIVLKALAKNPANRYQSAAEMRSDLTRAIAGRPVQAERLMSEDERTELLGAAAGQTAVASRQFDRLEEPHRRGNRRVWPFLLFGLGIVAAFAVGVLLLNLLTGHDTKNSGSGSTPKPTTPSAINSTKPSQGPRMIAVPSVIGFTTDAAEKTVRDAGLVPEIKTQDAKGPTGTIIATSPNVSTSVTPGSTVTLFTPSGRLVMPDVRGKQEDDARKALTDAGFTNIPDSVETEDADVAPSTVVDQKPAPGAAIPGDTPIMLTIAVPPANPTPTPSQTPTETTPPPTSSSPSPSPTPTTKPAPTITLPNSGG